jgi:hypothetical protein
VPHIAVQTLSVKTDLFPIETRKLKIRGLQAYKEGFTLCGIPAGKKKTLNQFL